MASNCLHWFVLSTLLALTSSFKTLCPRIFFQNINEKTMPYKLIEGVYVKEKDNHNNFPVYHRENDNLQLFLYIGTKGDNFLMFGQIVKDSYFGVAATVSSDPLSWLNSGTLDRDDVFGGFVNQWQYYNSRDKTNYRVTSSPVIKAVCVDEDFRECNSDRVYLNENFGDGNGNTINNATTDYFYRSIGIYRNLRPVYEHSSQSWFLQYVDGYWLVTSSYEPSNYEENAYMRVKDLALRPEYISKTWSVHYNGWRDKPSLRVLCRGVTSMSNTCPSKPCDSKATCVFTSGNETVCLCPAGYMGVTCSDNKQCPTPHPKVGTELNFGYAGQRPGDLGMAFCSGSYPSVRYYYCSDDRGTYWGGLGSACTAESWTPTQEPWTPMVTQEPWYPRVTPQATTSKPINFDDYPIVADFVITMAVIIQVLLPFIFWCCAICTASCKETDEQEDDQRRSEQVNLDLERRLQRVAAAGSQEELDQGVQEYRQVAQQYQQETEQKELSRKRGFYRNASLWRLISIDMYFSFYLWLTYFVGCEMTHCTAYGEVFYDLRIFAMVMLILSPVIVMIESQNSHELDYLKNIMEDETAWGYIQRMQEVPPRISMVVECWHYETKTRLVYYTDANGNQQSRMETVTEQVVTFTEQQEFPFGSWVDVSKREIPDLSTAALTRVKIDPSILFGDQETEDEYERQVAEMMERNRHRDLFTDYSSSKDIPGLEKRISAYVDLKKKPFWIRPVFFWIATFMGLTWPYRWLFKAKTAKSYYSLTKKIYKSTTPPMDVDVMDPIAILVGNALSGVNSSGPDNSCPGYPMSEMTNLGTGNPSFQNGSTPYPAFNPYLVQGHSGSMPYSPVDQSARPSLPPYPVVPQPNAPPPSYVPAPYPPPMPYAGPVFPPNPAAGPLPSAPPLSYEATQPSNEKCPPVV